MVLLLLVPACATPPAALRADTVAYLQKMTSWAPIEAETASTLERILETEFVNQAEVLRQIADNRPRVERHLAEVERYAPRTGEVRRIHEVYARTWRELLAAYDSISAGFAGGDQAKLSAGRHLMARWRDGIMAVARDLRALRDRTGVEAGELTPS